MGFYSKDLNCSWIDTVSQISMCNIVIHFGRNVYPFFQDRINKGAWGLVVVENSDFLWRKLYGRRRLVDLSTAVPVVPASLPSSDMWKIFLYPLSFSQITAIEIWSHILKYKMSHIRLARILLTRTIKLQGEFSTEEMSHFQSPSKIVW